MINKEDREEYLRITQNYATVDDATKREISLIINQNKKRPRRRNLKLFTFGFSCVCLLICLILPTIALVYSHTNPTNPSAPSLTYYADEEARKEHLTSDQAKNLISPTYSKYDFLFNADEYTFRNAIAYYAQDDNELLAIHINVQEVAIPMTDIQFYLKISERFIYSEHEIHINDATLLQTTEYNLYKKSITDFNNNTTMYGFAEYANYQFYLKLNFDHEELFNKFL